MFSRHKGLHQYTSAINMNYIIFMRINVIVSRNAKTIAFLNRKRIVFRFLVSHLLRYKLFVSAIAEGVVRLRKQPSGMSCIPRAYGREPHLDRFSKRASPMQTHIQE